jgi:hypothetical protein
MTGMIKLLCSFVLVLKQPDDGIVPELHQGWLRTKSPTRTASSPHSLANFDLE